MRAVAIASAAVLAGCLPAKRATITNMDRRVEPAIVTHTGGLVVRSHSYSNLLVVEAAWPRECTSRVVDRVETRTTREAELAGTTDGDVWGWFVLVPAMVIVWPVTIVDLAITHAVVAGNKPQTTVAETPVGQLRSQCPLAARNIPIHLTLSSGVQLDATTGDDGTFAMLLPADAPGLVLVRADATRAPPAAPPIAPVTPAASGAPGVTPRGGVAGVRDAALACAARDGLTGVARIELVIENARIARITSDRPELTTCLRDATAGVRFDGVVARELVLPLLLARPPKTNKAAGDADGLPRSTP